MKLERTKRVGDKTYTYTRSPEAARKEYESNRKYAAKTYDRLTLDVPKGMLAELTALAETRGISRRQLILGLLERELKSTDN